MKKAKSCVEATILAHLESTANQPIQIFFQTALAQRILTLALSGIPIDKSDMYGNPSVIYHTLFQLLC